MSGVLDALLESFTGSGSAAAQARQTSAGQKPLSPATRARQRANAAQASARPYDEKKHPRGRAGTSQGGKFIRSGSSGNDVRAVQARVGVKRDGQFGNQTHNAVRDFQKRHGLQVDGVVGHQTALAIAGKYAAARRAQTGALRKSDRSAISKTRQPKHAQPKHTPRAPTRSQGGIVV
jgi:murein L,D-transpeptidase YcbB/YkuD